MTASPIVCRNCSGLIRQGAYRGDQCPYCLYPWAVLVLAEEKRPIKQAGFNNPPSRLVTVGRRCGWMCYLCGFSVPKPGVVDVSHPKAPTVDHVVPKAHGGSNRQTNLAITHMICNNRRGTNPLTREQVLRLQALQRAS